MNIFWQVENEGNRFLQPSIQPKINIFLGTNDPITIIINAIELGFDTTPYRKENMVLLPLHTLLLKRMAQSFIEFLRSQHNFKLAASLTVCKDLKPNPPSE